MAERVPGNMSVQRVLSPENWAKKQLDTIRAVGRTNYLIGIASPKASPITAGSSPQSEARFNASMQIALGEERRRKGVAASSDQEWYTYAKEIGADSLVAGVTKREAKVKDFIRSWHGILTNHLQTIDDMPTGTLEERISKMGENARGLSALHGAAKGY